MIDAVAELHTLNPNKHPILESTPAVTSSSICNMRNYMPGFVEGFTPMMNDEDDAPPELVNVAASAEPEQEENASRVPITLVTGTTLCRIAGHLTNRF